MNFIKVIKQLLLCYTIVNLAGCATIFIPGKQKVTITTSQPNARVYVNNEEAGEGKTVTAKVKKDAAKQVVVQSPGYKDAYHALVLD